ncbi:MAG: ketopantoate reductase family protein [Oscillospiraceae bacterium]|nr:ketopantoate reductase family protein [Oscillospiraceae bacterium]
MRVLIYGAGVIGGQLCHALCACGNKVTVVARGAWADTLRKEGLRIHHYIQKKDTIDHPMVLNRPDDTKYDIVFAVMQYKQMEAILEDLALVNSPIVVLVGNNLSASEMEKKLLETSPNPKSILFGFGSTAGTRENGKLTTVHVGDGKLTIGKAHSSVSKTEKTLLKRLFGGSKMSVSYCDDMDAWLKYHAAFILPIVYLCYKTGCDLKKSTRADRKLMLNAVGDAYHLLMSLGYPVRPVGDERSVEPGLTRTLVTFVIWLMSITRLGALCTTEHCKHAPAEMRDLDEAFHKFIETKPDFPIPSFEELYSSMPIWEKVFQTYPQNTSR